MNRRAAALSSVLKQGKPYGPGWYAVDPGSDSSLYVIVGPFADKAHALVVQSFLEAGNPQLHKSELSLQLYTPGQAAYLRDMPEELGYDRVEVLDVDTIRWPSMRSGPVDVERANRWLKMVADAKLASDDGLDQPTPAVPDGKNYHDRIEDLPEKYRGKVTHRNMLDVAQKKRVAVELLDIAMLLTVSV